MQRQGISAAAICAVVGLGALGCGARGGAATLGVAPAPAATVTPVRQLSRSADAAAPVTLRGTMVEKCAVAACWFRLRDRTGEVKVDVKDAGFTVTDVPLNAEVTVTGNPLKQGDVVSLAATGLRY
jgi:uncharacterized protein YdeI (BOF family)